MLACLLSVAGAYSLCLLARYCRSIQPACLLAHCATSHQASHETCDAMQHAAICLAIALTFAYLAVHNANSQRLRSVLGSL